METRPISVTVIGWIFVITGGLTFLAALMPFTGITSASPPPDFSSQEFLDLIFVLITRFLAIVGGTFLLYGRNWARWLIIFWMGFHVVISFGAEIWILIVHAGIFCVLLYFLFRPQASDYFKPVVPSPPMY